MNNKVYVVMHKVTESGEEDIFDVMKTFKNKKAAEKYACLLEDQIDYETNLADGLDEEYWIVPQTAENNRFPNL